MELDQITASVIAYVLQNIDAPEATPYLDVVPEAFKRPAVYFEPERTEAAGMTLTSFRVEHVLYAVMFGRSAREADHMARNAQLAICARRHMVPIINEDTTLTGRFVCVRQADTHVISAEEATAQLALGWYTTGCYARDGTPETQKIIHVNIRAFVKH